MTRDEYVGVLAGLLSREPERVADANRILYDVVVDREIDDGTDGPNPSLALVDAEQQLQG